MAGPTALERRNARWFLCGAIVSSAGTSAMMLAAGIWVHELTGSSSLAAAVGVALWAPTAAGVAVGPIVDRVRRRPLLIAGNLGLGVLLLLLLLVPGVAGWWLVFAVMAAYGAGFVLLDVAEAALMPLAVGQDALAAVNGRRVAGQEGVKLLAPAAGAGLFALAGAPAVVLLDVASFGLAAAAVARIRVREPAPSPDPGSWRRDLAGGLGLVWRSPRRRALVAVSSATTFAVGVNGACVYALVERMGRAPETAGVLAAAQGLGSVAAGLAAARLTSRLGTRAPHIGLALVATGAALRATAWLGPALAGSCLVGAGASLVLVHALTTLQRETAASEGGRVLAAATSVVYTAVPAGNGLAAALLSGAGVRTVLLGTAVLAGLAAAAGPSPRRRDRPGPGRPRAGRGGGGRTGSRPGRRGAAPTAEPGRCP
ncbi:MAG TPA: MFS transporter [Acidimicrobiales bacterium]